MPTYFSDFFGIDPAALDKHGALNISLVTDLPLFIDPFLLFNSKKEEYRALHEQMIAYLRFLKGKAERADIPTALIAAWYCFPEVRQNWLGFSLTGNSGHGLGMDFAVQLHRSLHNLFPDFGAEKITAGSHLEKVCLIRNGVGRDNISDFTTNLTKAYLCQYTEAFARQYLRPDQTRSVSVQEARFNYETETWQSEFYTLPWINRDHVILTPKDILTRDENWINRKDLISDFLEIPTAIPDDQLRAQIENYFHKVLVVPPDREPTRAEFAEAVTQTILEFPALIDYYIKYKEEGGHRAVSISSEKVRITEQIFIKHVGEIQRSLAETTPFYKTPGTTYDEAHLRLAYLKDVIENKGGHRIFYTTDTPIRREEDLQIIYRLVWIGTPSDVSREVNDGRGPADFKISRGAHDKTIVEMKLAKNTKLKANLEKQVEIYQAASDAKRAIKAILFFSEQEERKVRAILKALNLVAHKDIVLIDARHDNKPSGSRA